MATSRTIRGFLLPPRTGEIPTGTNVPPGIQATSSQNHTDLHTDTGTEHQRDPRRSHPDRDPRNHKPATATAITEITHPNRPTDARLGVHGDGGGPIGLEVHEVRQLSHLGIQAARGSGQSCQENVRIPMGDPKARIDYWHTRMDGKGMISNISKERATWMTC